MNITKTLVAEIAEKMIGKVDGATWDNAPLVHAVVAKALEAANEIITSEPIFAVFADHNERNMLLGYATGKQHDIESFFDDRKCYGLIIEEVKPVDVPSGYKAHRDNIIAKRDRLQAELDELNARLKSGVL
jgi:hypothetical protein